MHKLIVLLASAGLMLGFAGAAQAGTFSTSQSTLSVGLAALPVSPFAAIPGPATVAKVTISGTPGDHTISVGATVWQTVNFGPGTAVFTGVPLIQNLKLTITNPAATFTEPFAIADNNIGGGSSPVFGGNMALAGQALVIGQGGAITIPLSPIGGNIGETAMGTLLGNPLTILGGGPFRTGTAMITGVTTNVIIITNRGASNVQGVFFTLVPTENENVVTPTTNGGFVDDQVVGTPVRYFWTRVTITGTNNLESAGATQDGTVTLIAPIRVNTDTIAGVIPGRSDMTMTFVPEPGTMLLLVSGAVGLAVIGRRRMRK